MTQVSPFDVHIFPINPQFLTTREQYWTYSKEYMQRTSATVWEEIHLNLSWKQHSKKKLSNDSCTYNKAEAKKITGSADLYFEYVPIM